MTTRAKIEGVTRGEIWKINETVLVSNKENNRRFDYGKIEELANSIIANSTIKNKDGKVYHSGGVKNPLVGYKKDDLFFVEDGFRRTDAIKLCASWGYNIDEIPFITEDQRKIENKNKTQLFNILIRNDGKPLTSLEQAEIFKELIEKENVNQAEIAKQIGKSPAYVSDMLKVANLGEDVKEEIRQGSISTALVSDLMKVVKDESKALEVITEAKQEKASQPAKGNKKSQSAITAKDLKNNQTLNEFKSEKNNTPVIKDETPKDEAPIETTPIKPEIITPVIKPVMLYQITNKYVDGVIFQNKDIVSIIEKVKELRKNDPDSKFDINLVEQIGEKYLQLGTLNLVF